MYKIHKKCLQFIDVPLDIGLEVLDISADRGCTFPLMLDLWPDRALSIRDDSMNESLSAILDPLGMHMGIHLKRKN